MAPRKSRDTTSGPLRPAGPGRPKDLGKRAAILDAAKRMFVMHGYDGVSMDQIAARAGVSKLTVYSHFGDKESLFVAAVKSHCETLLPASLFEPSPTTPLRPRLVDIAHAFHLMISSPEALAGYRMLCTPQLTGSPLAELFWQAGPERIQDAFIALLRRRIAAGGLDIDVDDPQALHRAATQFFALVKGELHVRQLIGCAGCDDDELQAHLEAAVDVFLKAYGREAAR